ncbi:MAG: hypothetical protein DRP57_02105 [Spirochaetes bacterium]|nr:MAG: hypothetical protein DRP57_02105 [Spirochaetota bacterium]
MFGKLQRFSIATLFTLFFCFSPLYGIDNLMMDLTVGNIKKAGPPRLIGRDIIFTFSASKPIRFVGLRFKHENYKILHTYVRNRNGIFLLIYPVPENLRELTYRIVEDGIWMADPFNPDVKYNDSGTAFSFYEIKDLPKLAIVNPKIEKNSKATFYLRIASGHVVTITGDFNSWDPFIDKLKEQEPGLYGITLKVLPGRHYYYFLIDGKKLIDPYNLDIREDYEGYAISSFLMPP